MPARTSTLPSHVAVTIRLIQFRMKGLHLAPARRESVGPATPAAAGSWAVWGRRSLGVLFIFGFVLLTWVRAESLNRMMPHLVDLGLGVLAGVIGNSLGYWFGLLGIEPAPACTATQVLKLAQIVGVPVAYLLLGGHMLLMPITGAVLAAVLVIGTQRLGLTKCSRRG